MPRISRFIFILLFLYNSFVPAQNAKALKDSVAKIKLFDTQITQAQILAHSNPTEAKKKLLLIKEQCEETNNKKGAMRSSMCLLLIYYNDGNYKKSIEESRFVEKYAKELMHTEYISDVHRMKGISYGEMGLIKECLTELGKALPYADKIESPHIRFYKKALIYEAYANTYDKEGNIDKQIYYRQKSIIESNKMAEKNQLIINAKYQNLAYQYASLGLVYSNSKLNDSANYYFDKALIIHENKKYDIYINGKATLLSDMAKFFSTNGNNKKAILFAKRAEALEKQSSLPYIRKDIYQTLFNAYVDTSKQDSSKYYLKLFSALNDSIIKSEKKNLMTPVNQIISDNEKETKGTVRGIFIGSALIILISTLTFWIYWRRKNKISQKKYKMLIAKIKSEQEDSPVVHLAKKENSEVKYTVSITDETIKLLLGKLEKFELSEKYLRKDLSLTWMANNLNTNPRYLSEIIKIYRDKSFTNYINGLRIEYITKKLYQNPVYREYKINYLSEECGYMTPRVFVNAFKNETGFTPSYFVEQLKSTS